MPATIVFHPMEIRIVETIESAGHEIAEVDDERAVDRRRFDPIAIGIARFQTAGCVLRQDGNAAPIMRPAPI